MKVILNVLILIFVFTIGGCAFNREVVLQAEGKNVRTPYGKGDGKFLFESRTQIGGCRECPQK